MRIHPIGWFALGFISTLSVTGAIAAARAEGRSARAPAGDYVVAESREGTGRVVGRVRQTSLGPQVQLPGGSWVYCRRSCSETLRVETVDFWKSRDNPGAGAREAGFFDLRWERRW